MPKCNGILTEEAKSEVVGLEQIVVSFSLVSFVFHIIPQALFAVSVQLSSYTLRKLLLRFALIKMVYLICFAIDLRKDFIVPHTWVNEFTFSKHLNSSINRNQPHLMFISNTRTYENGAPDCHFLPDFTGPPYRQIGPAELDQFEGLFRGKILHSEGIYYIIYCH